MKLRKLIYVFTTVAMLLACRFATNLSGGSGSTNQYQYIFQPPKNPIRLTISLDKTHSVQAAVSTKGGQLTTTGADGTVYTLEIPDKALASATIITITPIVSIAGQPFDGKTAYAVQLEPEGLYLYYDAILTIAPSKPIPLAQQLFFDYKADGQTVGLAFPVVDSKELKIRLMHFSGYGVADGTAADVATVQQQLGGDAEGAIQSLAAETVAEMRENLDNRTNTDNSKRVQTILDLVDEYEQNVVKPALESAGDSCAAGKDAIRKVLSMERTRQLMGMPSKATPEDLAALITTAAKQCVKEEYQRCVDEHVINRMIPLYVGLMRQYQLLGGTDSGPEPEEIQLARDLTAKCLTFELDFHSEGSFDTGDGGYKSTVDGKVMLYFDPNSFTIQGSGPLDNLDFEFQPPKGGRGMKCTADSKTGGSTFEVKMLEYVEDTRSETDPEPYVRDFNLLYFPGVTSESYNIHCILTDSQGKQTFQDYASPPSGYWTGIFFTLHSEELNAGSANPMTGGMPPFDMQGIQMGALPAMPAPTMPEDGGFFANDWTITSGDVLIASKEWIKDNPSINLTETGTLKLYHKPGN